MNQGITAVSGIGESTKNVLAEHGIKTISDLAKANAAKLAAVKGFGEFRAARAIAAAAALLKTTGAGAAARSKAGSAKKAVKKVAKKAAKKVVKKAAKKAVKKTAKKTAEATSPSKPKKA